MKTASAFLLLLASSVAPSFAAAPVWDNSGNSLLSGTYYFREVLYVADLSGNTSRALTLYGNITFNGGSYSLSGLGGLDSVNGVPDLNPIATYSLSSSGYGFMSDPLVGGNSVSILVSNGVIVGSDTEAGTATAAGYNSIFIAAPMTSLSTSSFTGAYSVSAYFPGSTPGNALGAKYQLNADGAGHLSNFTISGFSGNGQGLTQNASSIPYKFSNNAAILTYPSTSGNFYNGQIFMYFSPDSNFVFGGSENDYDIFIGVKNATPGASTPLSGLYYEAGMEQFGYIDSFYGTLNALPDGNIVGHERIQYSGDFTYGTSYRATYPTPLAGSYTTDSGVEYTIGQNGFRIGYATGGYLLMSLAIPYTPPAATGAVYLDPTGIVNTASSAPYTSGVSPGEFVTIYNGTNLAASTVVASDVPYPTTLGGVKVLIDGTLAAPIYYVSPTQISFIVPYDVSIYPITSIQISNNNVLSNVVTMNVNKTTPGVFTASPVGGIGVAALLDFPAAGGYYVVDSTHPAHPGDNVAAYLTGLGTPFPGNPSGAAGPLEGDSLIQTIRVDVAGTDVGTPGYAGLAPGLAGLYQLNFKIPTTATAGNSTLGILGPDSFTNESYIPIALGDSAVEAAKPVPNTRRQGPPRIGIELHR